MFQGTFPALITPFRQSGSGDPQVDLGALAEFVEWQIASGVDGVVANGTTAESATLTEEEKISTIKRVIEVVRKRVPVIVGTGTNNTRETVQFTRTAKELGADAALVVSPYYNKPTQEGLFQHFSLVAREGGLPVMLYNIPGRSSVEIATETMARLAAVPGIFGVKQSVDSASRLVDILAVVPRSFGIYSGECSLTQLMMAVGGVGTVSASANVIPKEMVSITSAMLRGEREVAQKAQEAVLPIIRALFRETNPAPAKAALKMMGIIPDDAVRLPLVSVQESTRAELRQVLGLS